MIGDLQGNCLVLRCSILVRLKATSRQSDSSLVHNQSLDVDGTIHAATSSATYLFIRLALHIGRYVNLDEFTPAKSRSLHAWISTSSPEQQYIGSIARC